MNMAHQDSHVQDDSTNLEKSGGCTSQYSDSMRFEDLSQVNTTESLSKEQGSGPWLIQSLHTVIDYYL